MPQNLNSSGVRATNDLTVKYRVESETQFKVDGDFTISLVVNGNRDYVKYWLRDKLRKFESGEIKVVKFFSGERDWEQEGRIRKQLWEDIEINEVPKGFGFQGILYEITDASKTIICTTELQTYTSPPRPSSPCRIS